MKTAFDTIHHEKAQLHTYDLDPAYTARLPYYFQLMQESAANHSYQYQLTIPDLFQQHKTWLMIRQRLEVHRYSEWPEEITVSTWVLPTSRLVSPRAFSAVDSCGRLLFEGLAQWCVLDLQRRRPVPISTIGNFPGIDKPDFSMHRVIGKPQPALENSDKKYLFHPQIQYRDTDINGHVNNNTYSVWCLESLPVEIKKMKNPVLFEIHYIRETYIDDQITVSTAADTDTGEYRHTITALREGKPVTVCQAASRWKDRSKFS